MPRFGATLVAAAVSTLIAAPIAHARPANRNFWDWVADPNGDEIAAVMSQTDRILVMTRDLTLEGPDGAGARHLLQDAYGMLRYARGLEPDRPEVLFSLGQVADLLGRPKVAIDALEHALKVCDEDDQHAYNAHIRLGMLQAERGDLDRAATQLRIALGSPPPVMLGYSTALPALADVYMAKGRLDLAIELLEGHDHTAARLFDGDLLVPLSLAVAFDRDDQRSRAYDVLTKLTQTDRMVERLLRSSRGGLGSLRFVDPRERHYYVALLCEATGMLDEARSEWLEYAAAAPHSRYAARALIHARDILALQRKQARGKHSEKKEK